MLFSLLLILAGLTAAAQWISARAPAARSWLEPLGAGADILGLCLLVSALLGLILATQPQPGLVGLGAWILGLVLGFFLGFGTLVRWIARNPGWTVKAELARSRIGALQVPLGLAAVGFGVVGLF